MQTAHDIEMARQGAERLKTQAERKMDQARVAGQTAQRLMGEASQARVALKAEQEALQERERLVGEREAHVERLNAAAEKDAQAAEQSRAEAERMKAKIDKLIREFNAL